MKELKFKEVIHKALKYPTGYEDFSNGDELEENEKVEFIEECATDALNAIKRKSLDKYVSTISTGNFIVYVEVYRINNKNYDVYINVSENYKELHLTNVKL